MAIYFGTNKPTKIYMGTTEVKKVYFGTTLVWPETETGLSESLGTKQITFGDNGNGDQYAIVLEMIVTEKNYSANTMKVKVKVSIRSLGNYYITASTTRTATITIDGTADGSNVTGYTATVSAGATKTLGTTKEVTISSASSKTVTVSISVPLGVDIADGVGYINTVTGSTTFTLPTL